MMKDRKEWDSHTALIDLIDRLSGSDQAQSFVSPDLIKPFNMWTTPTFLLIQYFDLDTPHFLGPKSTIRLLKVIYFIAI